MNQNIKNFYKKCNAYKRVCLGGTSMKLCVSAPGKRFGDASGGCAGNPKNNSIRHPLFACTAGFMRPSGVSLFNAIGEIVKGGLRIVLERKPGLFNGLRIVLERKPGLFNQVPGRGDQFLLRGLGGRGCRFSDQLFFCLPFDSN